MFPSLLLETHQKNQSFLNSTTLVKDNINALVNIYPIQVCAKLCVTS